MVIMARGGKWRGGDGSGEEGVVIMVPLVGW